MSRIGKKIIIIPEGVTVESLPKEKGQVEIKVKGPKGELSALFSEMITIKIVEKEISVSLNPKFSKMVALWGTTRANLANMIEGVVSGFEKKLELNGIGYKVNLQGNKLVLDVGYSKSVEFMIPEGITANVEKNVISISGINKQKVGEVAAQIKKVRKVDPYKGKGLRYVGEIVRRKEGKKAVGESG